MIRRGVQVQLLVFLVITLLGVSYVGGNYVGLTDKVLGGSYVVTADFAESGGIFTNAEVTYRGVSVGRVGELELTKDGVLVELRIDRGNKVPTDTRAVVANRSAVGEQYIDLQPRRDGSPYLGDGSRIARADTVTPLPVQTLLLNLDRLVNSVDREDLVTVIDEMGAAFGGTGPDLQRMIDSGNALTLEATEHLPETIRLIDDGRTVLATQRESGSAIKSFAHDLALLSQTLRERDGDLRRIFESGTVAARELETLLRENRPAIAELLGNLLTASQITVARLDGFEQILVTFPDVVAGGYTVVPGDGTAHFGLSLNSDHPPACQYPGTKRRTPHQTSDTPADHSRARCTNPPPGAQIRGSANAPRPRSGASATGATFESDADTPYIGGYDARTGELLGVDGQPLLLGSRGGQQRLFGEDSWQWLLLGPLGR
jgi:phospholipid/cholesterol/gamma-HCH transport system substrate-binding protein